MKVEATLIKIESAWSPLLWYADKIGQQFWAEYVGSAFCWKVIQEGAELTCSKYIHKDDVELIRTAMVRTELVQAVKEIGRTVQT